MRLKLKSHRYQYLLLFLVELLGILHFPTHASVIHDDVVLKHISDAYLDSKSVDNFGALLNKLDDLRHSHHQDKQVALAIYCDILPIHDYLEAQSDPHQNRFYRGIVKTCTRLEEHELGFRIITQFILTGRADLVTRSLYYDQLYFQNRNKDIAVQGWEDICCSAEADDTLKASAHLKLADHLKQNKKQASAHFKKALQLSQSDQSVLDLNSKAKALIGLAQLEDNSENRRGLFLDAFDKLNSIRRPKSFHTELLIQTRLGLAQNSFAPYRERRHDFKQALELARSIDDYYSQAQAHIGLGNMLDDNRDRRQHYQEVIKLIGRKTQEHDRYLLAQAYIGLGNIADTANFNEALSALTPLGKDYYPHLWAQAYIGLGQNTDDANDNRKLYFKKAIRIGKKHRKYHLVAQSYIGMGNAHFGRKYFEKALGYLEKNTGDQKPRLWAQAYLGLANSLARSEVDDQIYYYEKARNIAYDYDYQSLLEKAYWGLGHAYLYKKESITSLEYLHEVYKISGDREIIERHSNKFYVTLKELVELGRGRAREVKQPTSSQGAMLQDLPRILQKNLSRLTDSEKGVVNYFALEGFKTLRLSEKEAIRTFFPSLKRLTDEYFDAYVSSDDSSAHDSSVHSSDEVGSFVPSVNKEKRKLDQVNNVNADDTRKKR